MRKSLFLLAFLINSEIVFGQTVCDWCITYELTYQGDKFQGRSDQHVGYDISLETTSGFNVDSLNLDYLISFIKENDIKGSWTRNELEKPNQIRSIYPNDYSDIKYSLIPYNDSLTIYMKTTNGWYPWERIKIENNKIIFTYDYWHTPLPQEIDFDILDLCDKYFADSTFWNKNDDRSCADDSVTNKWSLFCAIRDATIKVKGDYDHRGYIIQTAREAVYELNPDNDYRHTMRDFNNDPSTSYKDIIKVLNRVRAQLSWDLEKKN